MNAESVVLKAKETGGGLGKGVQGKSHEVVGRGGKASIPSADGKCSEGPFSLLLSCFKPIVDTH